MSVHSSDGLRTVCSLHRPGIFTLSVVTSSSSSLLPIDFCHLLKTSLGQFPSPHTQNRLVRLIGRVGRPQPAATLSLLEVSLLDGNKNYILPSFCKGPRNSYALSSSPEYTTDVPCPKEATKRRVRESTQPP